MCPGKQFLTFDVTIKSTSIEYKTRAVNDYRVITKVRYQNSDWSIMK